MAAGSSGGRASGSENGGSVDAPLGYLDEGDEWSSEPPERDESRAGGRSSWPEGRTPAWLRYEQEQTKPEAQPGRIGRPPSSRSAPPRGRSGPARAQGFARSVQLRYDTGASEDILSFRLDSYDESGNRLPPVPVELRGMRLRGQITEGEEVEAVGEWRGGTIVADRVTNLTTSADVSVWSMRVPAWVKIALVVVPLAIAAVIGVLVLQSINRNADRAAQLPDVVGRPEFFAEKEVEGKGFVPQMRHEASPSMPEGRVTRTDPPAGAKPPKGSLVAVYVSVGPTMRTLANVTGKDVFTAMIELGHDGFRPTRVEEPSATVPASRVIRTEPPAGTPVGPRAEVRVVVSSGRGR